MRSESKEVIKKNTGAVWNRQGMTIDTILDPLITFVVRIIAHKLYQSSRLNSVPCISVDMGYKIIKKDHTYDLAKLQIQQLIENLGAIRRPRVHNVNLVQLLYVCSSMYRINYIILVKLHGKQIDLLQ